MYVVNFDTGSKGKGGGQVYVWPLLEIISNNEHATGETVDVRVELVEDEIFKIDNTVKKTICAGITLFD